MIEQATASGARTLLLIVGQPPALRIGETVETPFGRLPLVYQQTQAWAQELLTDQQIATLEKDGTVEVEFRRPNAQGRATVFFGQGSHNIVLHLGF